MPLIRFSDGSTHTTDQSISAGELAYISHPKEAARILAVRLNNQLLDLDTLIREDAHVEWILPDMPEGLEVIRHSTAHLLAQAIKQLFPQAQITIGPVIEDGFYYDVYYPSGFAESDLAALEERMQSLVKAKLSISHRAVERSEAESFFTQQGETYKVKIIQELPEGEVIKLYQQGDFTDLCRGPHVPHTGHLGAFKLTRISGAYWRGNSNNEMLQRIYGTAWATKDDLKAHLHFLEEAKKRDHRRLCVEHQLAHFDPIFPGMVSWMPKGWTLFRIIRQYIQSCYDAYGYQSISTPILADVSLWEKSGHLSKFSHEMFLTESENRTYAIKPMSCPLHIELYNQTLHSYRELPVRLAEFGCCHRNELSGALHGLMRVRAMTQDDGHIFCTQDQIASEVKEFNQQLYAVYQDFGFTVHKIKLSTRPEKRIGSDELWDKAENSLKQVLNESETPWELAEGDGAFYGPKLEFYLQDSLKRLWQCGTMQLDFFMPERLGATYIDEKGEKAVPVMLHRAMLGSLERFMGILIEECGGRFPAWLAPIQVMVMTITDDQHDYARKVLEMLKKEDIRAQGDLRNEKIGFKIRQHTLQRVPYLLILGAREKEEQLVSVRLSSGEELGSVSINSFLQRVKAESIKVTCG